MTRAEGGPPARALPARVQVAVIGSGAGGAVTAAVLAERGYDVVVLEEGPDRDTAAMETNSPAGIAQLYRHGGVTPILGRPAIAYVEGCCVGGSTEVNSAFWHRLPDDCYDRWRRVAQLAEFSPETLAPYFAELERVLSVSYLSPSEPPPSSRRFRAGLERLGWSYVEVPRCQSPNDGISPFAPGNKQSMQRTFLPRARAAGARLVADCRALRLVHRDGRVAGVQVERRAGFGRQAALLHADVVFACGGAMQTAALLRRSGITRNVGDNLCLHPMIKAAAVFDEVIDAHAHVLPIYQVKEFWPDVAIGGSVFSPGFLAMMLADSWQANRQAMADWRRMALYYAATRGSGRGRIRVVAGTGEPVARYQLTAADQVNLSAGLARLGEILFAAGARAVYPSLRAPSVLTSAAECRALLERPIPMTAMALSSVHAFSSCPMGENPALCAADSFGRVHGFDNLYINDASLLPDSPGVNPQGTIMAVALRNLDHFAAARPRPRRRRGAAAPAPAVLITGAPGWLGSRLLEVLARGLPGAPDLALPDGRRGIRCLAHPAVNPDALLEAFPDLEVVSGDLADAEAGRALCAGAEGAVLFHIAGIVHPDGRTAAFDRINVDGTLHLLRAARAAGVRRVVAVSSNSPFGFNPTATHVFDESSPYAPYMGYGRSKQRMEEAVFAAHAAGGLEAVVIRPPWFYGPHQPPRQTQFLRMVQRGRFPILGDGTQRRSMVYVDNLCQGLLRAAVVPAAAGEAYWIADAEPYAINEIVATVRAVLEDDFGIACTPRQLRLPALVADLARAADGALQAVGRYQQQVHVLGEMRHSIACSIAKARRELGYAPTVGLREGMRESIRWCLAAGMRFR